MNHTVTPRTGFKPVEMIFGKDNIAKSFLDRESYYQLVRNSQEQINKLSNQLRNMSEKARQDLLEIRQETHEKN